MTAPAPANGHTLLMAGNTLAPCIGCTLECFPRSCELFTEWVGLLAKLQEPGPAPARPGLPSRPEFPVNTTLDSAFSDATVASRIGVGQRRPSVGGNGARPLPR